MSSTINKTELISKLQTLKGLTNEERSNLIGLLRQKKYGLVWEDKPEDIEERLREELPVLREVKQRAIVSADKDAPNHIIIEGDNLEALTALSYTHEGRIDVIYIDPPYNTGNKDFIYNDSFVDKEDSYRHSKWLSFMNKRLKIAKRLLSEKGVIFISIDDNEQAQLKLLCDEILGKSNFIAQFIWSAGRKNDSKYVSISHEYIICYVKNIDYLKEYEIIWREKKQGVEDIYQSVKNFQRTYGNDYSQISLKLKQWYKSLPENHPARNHKHYNYVDERGIYFPSDISWPGGGGPRYEVLHPQTHRPVRVPNRGWVFPSSERMQEMISLGLVHFGEDETSVPCKKTYLKDNEFAAPYSVFYKDGRAATKRLRSILGKDMFQNPKDEEIMQRLLALNSNGNSTILDFFAGSGTTLHATMQLNNEDGGHRQCILVTNNENNICEDVTYERNKRVINGYTTPKGVEVEGLKSNTLRYYKTDYISRDRTQKNMRDLVNASTDLLCIKEDLYTEKNKFGRYRVNPRLMRYFSDGKKHMLVVYREEIVDQLAVEIANLDFGDEKLKIYIFSPARYAFNDNFAEVSEKVTLVALPAAIYDAYEKVLPKRKEKLFELVEEARVASETTQDLFSVQEEGGEQ